ncbi:DMT family transporter [Candidatus Aalborgicola defluviihabitans]|jgi:drug/metabolite transporter (DMT)-like permease|uniref:DMT family transporter n=1 Tax=Candidatus Aalborgicola defluviihabitans TaxID=3386187 RepID=UPI001D7B37EA|nr:EamA family transporter [Burkholderiales bacterium]MBK6568334.1 EamA family transporter [Burkholderiales bacterium]MBK7280389.1 EamA family transporter [Burkholderiales bacterium]MBK7313471.1 EamA family transporter [Burkholderiales bacterium]MBL0244389.1 EamA family transporter [Rhodoferax sp.]
MKTKHFAQLVMLSALWGASFMLIRLASPVLGPNVLAALRIGMATLTLAVLMFTLRQPWPRGHWRELALIGLLSVALPFLLFAWAALQIPAGYSALLNSTAVLFGIFASTWMGEDTLNARKVVGCLLGLGGVTLIVGLGPVEPSWKVALAALGCVLASACYGVSTPLMKRALSRMEPLQITAGLHAAAFLMLLPGALWSWPSAHFTPVALLAVVIMGVITSGIAYWLHIRILAHVTPVAAMSPTFLIPVFGVTWGHVFLGEQLSTSIFLGGGLVLMASALVTGYNPWQKQHSVVNVQP